MEDRDATENVPILRNPLPDCMKVDLFPGARRTVIVGLLLGAALLATTLVYRPSLSGGYVFDDFPNIVDNRDVHLAAIDWNSLRAAALSSPSALLVRPLAMLSFGLNWYADAGDPRSMKIVNLGIHLLNGLLLFGLLRAIVRQIAPDRRPRGDLLAAVVSSVWLLAPINFTAVAYIVQRMESLCQAFVLGGLWVYVSARGRMRAGGPGLLTAFAALVLATALGGLAKESAALLPLYAAVVEWVLFGFAGANGKPDRRLYAMYTIVLLIPACAAMYWVWKHAVPAQAWTNRPFTLVQRLLTEPRIVLDYVGWSLLPTPNALALYHDQISVSRGLFDPASTAVSIACLATSGVVAVCVRRRWPLAAIGVLWFLAAHLLTATVIPLELAYEHRNYFASAGLYLAVFSLLLPDAERAKWAIPRLTGCAALAALFVCVTWIRASDWADPLSLAISEAQKNPQSPRTAYELGRMYVILSRYNAASPYIPEAYAALEHAAAMPGADSLPDQGLVLLSARLHHEIPRATWERLEEKLRTQPLSAQNVGALYSLVDCAVSGACQLPPAEMVGILTSALAHKPPDVHVLSAYSNYAINVLRDVPLALELARATVEQAPTDMQARKNLLLLLTGSGQREAAENFYNETVRDLPQAANDATFRDLLRRNGP